MIAVSIDHRGAALRRKLREQAQLGGAILVHGLVIIEMVLRQVGEGNTRELNRVEAVLREAGRRGLHRHVRYAVIAQRLQGRMNGNRVRRGVAKIDMTVRPDRAERTHAR